MSAEQSVEATEEGYIEEVEAATAGRMGGGCAFVRPNIEDVRGHLAMEAIPAGLGVAYYVADRVVDHRPLSLRVTMTWDGRYYSKDQSVRRHIRGDVPWGPQYNNNTDGLDSTGLCALCCGRGNLHKRLAWGAEAVLGGGDGCVCVGD